MVVKAVAKPHFCKSGYSQCLSFEQLSLEKVSGTEKYHYVPNLNLYNACIFVCRQYSDFKLITLVMGTLQPVVSSGNIYPENKIGVSVVPKVLIIGGIASKLLIIAMLV